MIHREYTPDISSSIMKRLFMIALLVPISICFGEPATPGTILTFYITDDNLNTQHHTAMTISTAGLVDFTINGVPVSGPSDMVETGIDTSTFQIQLTLPDNVNGKPLQNGDVVVMTYHQQADYSGHPQTMTQSRVLTTVPAGSISSTIHGSASSIPGVQIGHYFTLQIYLPDSNLDSFHPDDVPLNMVEFRMGGFSTTLDNPVFHVTTGALRETGPDTGIFQATFQIPKVVDGFPVEIGSTLEFRYEDPSNPSSVYVRVGTYGIPNQNQVPLPSQVPLTSPTLVIRATDSAGAIVNYLNSTILYGLKSPICNPNSGSFFTVGKTTVTCSAVDQLDNSVIKTFTINVIEPPHLIPSWVKKLVGFACDQNIGDDQLHSSIQYLVINKIMQLQNYSTSLGEIPDKTSLCLWANGKISDYTVYKSLYLLSR